MKFSIHFTKILGLILFLSAITAYQASANIETEKEKALLKKNFYLLYLLENNSNKMASDVMKQIAEARKNRLTNAINNCKTSACLVEALQLDSVEIAQIGSELFKNAKNNNGLITELRNSKTYANFSAENDSAFLIKSWKLTAQALNRILAVYVNGAKPTYPKIDAGDFAPDDATYFQKLKQMLQDLAAKDKATLPFQILAQASLKILLMNERDEAIRYEPLEAGWNKDAVKKIAAIKWNKYPFSAILVPGLGPEQEGLKLDPNGAKRCDSAAKRYFAGVAPFIVVSGGHVHPNKTPFAEAVEMKKYLIEVLKVPSNAILIEPHARHTTTNLRNLNRMIYRFKMPADKKILIVTDASQSGYIVGNMKNIALRDLGYVPYSSIKKISATETEYLPNETSMQINPLDPLDPK